MLKGRPPITGCSVGLAVEAGGIRISEGDVVIGDEDGIVVLTQEQANEVAAI